MICLSLKYVSLVSSHSLSSVSDTLSDVSIHTGVRGQGGLESSSEGTEQGSKRDSEREGNSDGKRGPVNDIENSVTWSWEGKDRENVTVPGGVWE